ncbi:Short-chain dehydrogenase TIC 32, chloroplastic [Fonsecaea pedrosoi]|nr:Short-chain dehydrogenase TIC 32, chloroplastic [Fonsecaea pedrosoi]
MTTRYAEAHVPSKLAGPGDSRPTALQIIADNRLENALSDKVMLVTGTSAGIGVETVRALAATGAKVYATARNLDKARAALGDDLLQSGRVELLLLDTADFASVRRCAAEFLARETKLNVLVNNAGVMAVPERQLTRDGHEVQFQTNHLGHFLLFQLLKPALLAASSPAFQSRVVNVSSIGHRQSRIVFDDLTLSGPGVYTPYKAYGQSKTANIYMSNEIERRYNTRGIHSWSLHPGGIIETGLASHMDVSAIVAIPEVQRCLKSVAQGAATTVLAAVDKELEGTGVSPPFPEGAADVLWAPGYAPWCYDVDDAKRLWEVSCQIVGVEDDQ